MSRQPERPDDEAVFPIINQLAAAPDNAARALILLQLSDQATLAYPMELSAACGRLGFEDGQLFVALRAALLCATRDQHGLLPEKPAAELEHYRQALSHAAAMGAQHV